MSDQLELRRPHGFLMWRGKKTAIARPAGQELQAGSEVHITCDGEAFGTAALGEPVRVKAADFDGDEWFGQHRVFPKERKAWWPDAEEFLVYPVDTFEALSKPRWLKSAAPNYGPTKAPERCATCLEYSDGFCRLHDMVVEDNYVCDDWDDFEDWRGGKEEPMPVVKIEGSVPPFADMKVSGWGNPQLGAKAYTGAMVAMFLPEEDAKALAMDLGEGSLSADELHITLLFLGDSTELENRAAAEQAVADLAGSLRPLEGKINGYGVFTGGKDGDVLYLSYDAQELPAFRETVVKRMSEAGFEQAGDHGFTPHVTLAYLQDGQEVPALDIEKRFITFSELTLAWGGERVVFPLGVQRGTSGGKVEGQKESCGAGIQALDAVAAAPRLPKEGRKEAEAMPYEKREEGGQWCVFKVGAEEPMKCYDSEERADAYLTALRINVEAAEKAVDLAEQTERIVGFTKALGLDEGVVESIIRDYLRSKASGPTKSEGDGDHPKGHYLVVEDPEKPSTWHLRVRNVDGELDHRLMGGAWAALHGGYRGNKYQGPDKQKAIDKLKRLYEGEGLPVPGEKDAGEEPDEATITKERGEGQGQGGERQGDGGAGACECPECGKEFSHEKGTPCSKRSCPDCDVPLVGSNGETEEEETAEKALEAGSEVDTKAGRRLKRSMKERIQEAVATLKEVLGWAEYSDQEPEGGLASFFKMDADHASGMGVKAVNGEPWMFTWTTNAFKDRQKEIFSTKCLEQYVTEAEAKGDRGTYDLWHIKGTDFANVEWQGVIGRFLVEAGPFHDTPIGRAAKAFFTKYPDGHPQHAPEGWGSSPEFRYLPEERKSGVYDWIWIVRRAVLPRAAAANVWTRGTEVSAMALTKQQEALGKDILGEDLLSQIVQEAESRTKELEDADVAHKAAEAEPVDEEFEELADTDDVDGSEEDEEELFDDSEPEGDFESEEGKAETAQVEVDVKAIAEQLAAIFEVKLDPMTELAEQVQTLAQDVKALRGELQAVKGKEAVKQQVETPRFVLNLTKKASNAEETLVEEDNPLLKMKPVENPGPRVSGASHFFDKKG